MYLSVWGPGSLGPHTVFIGLDRTSMRHLNEQRRERELRTLIGRKRRNAKQFAVLGLGRFGSGVVKALAKMGYEVLGVDTDEERVQAVADYVTHAVQADSTDEAALRSLGLRNFDVAVVGIGDLEPSVLTTVILKDFGVPYVVAKAVSELHGKVLQRVGADRVVFPERDMGIRVAHNLVSLNLVEYLELAPGVSIIEAVARRSFVGKSLKELALRARYDINILAIRRGETINLGPSANDVIEEGDILVAMGRDKALEVLEYADGDEEA